MDPGLAANQTAATSAHRIAELNIAVAGLGEYYKRAHVRKALPKSRRLGGKSPAEGVAAGPNYRWSVVMGPIPHDSAPNPLALFLVAIW